jgi:transglutaminase/protease-like cytokinesis protein 3
MNKWFLILFAILSNIAIYAQISDFNGADFRNADKIAYFQKGANLKNLPKLANDLTANLPTDLEKFRAIYIWVCTNIENDYDLFLKNKEKRNQLKNDSLKLTNWNNSFKSKVFVKLLNDHKTICTGYAYLIKTLSNLANINCVIIDGYGLTVANEVGKTSIPNHSWNAVQLNNKWYLCDATWSSGNFDVGESKFKYDYNDGYFLANPELFAKNHYPIDSTWLLTNEKADLNNFLEAPLVYNKAFNYEILPIEPLKMRIEVEKNKEASFFLKHLKSINLNQITIELVSGTDSKTVKPTIIQLEENILEIKYTFKNRGLYDLHIKIEDSVILTYVAKVKKEKNY